ncbi:MAG: MEKHLA domain-containing protein [Gallionella sp.]
MPSLPPPDAALDDRLQLLVESYFRLTGKELITCKPQDVNASRQKSHQTWRQALWDAPRAIVAHGTEADPIFFYGNKLALNLFEMDFMQFIRLPSRLSAELVAQELRARLMAQVSKSGFIEGYSGMRIASSGKRFMITDATIWNIRGMAGVLHGQAAVFISEDSRSDMQL